MEHTQMKSETESFDRYLKKSGLSKNSRLAYCYAVANFKIRFGTFTQGHLLAYKEYLQLHYKPQTVNLRLQGLNKYLQFSGKKQLCLPFVKQSQRKFLEQVISNADYCFLKQQLNAAKDWRWYFLVWFLAATGARVGEAVKVKVEDVALGYVDLYAKGGKLRRLYIPKNLCRDMLSHLVAVNQKTGFLFLNRYGKQLTTRGIAAHLKVLAERYGIASSVMHPHSFRHRFALNFLNRHKDIALLADLMGHESIETTRIYLRKTAEEQQTLVNTLVTW